MGPNRPEVVLDPLIQRGRGAERIEQRRTEVTEEAEESDAVAMEARSSEERNSSHSQMWMWVLLQLWFVSYTGSLHARDKGQGTREAVACHQREL